MMNDLLKQLLDDVPEYDSFLTVEEMDESSRKLAKEFPEQVSLFEIGRTREDRPILCLKIGNGSKNALMYGLPHPNEPIGTAMLEYFTRKLAENEQLRKELDYTWYIIKAWDADGYKKNEKWIRGPFTLYQYSRNFFRPAGYEQVDWTFPIRYKKLNFEDPLPETLALKKLIDEIRPEFIYALHNAGFGGVYWYVTEDLPSIYEELRSIAEQEHVPVNYGEGETIYLKRFAPAIFRGMGIGADYDYLEQSGIENPQEILKVGTCAADYARERYQSFAFLTELPYFFDPQIEDTGPSDLTRKEAILQNLDWSEKANRFIRGMLGQWETKLTKENPFLHAVQAFSVGDNDEAYRKTVETEQEYQRSATVAEKFDTVLVSRFYKLLTFGMLIRIFEWEIEQDETKQELFEEAVKQAEEAHLALSKELEQEISYQVIPIRKLVRILLGCGLCAAREVRKRGETRKK